MTTSHRVAPPAPRVAPQGATPDVKAPQDRSRRSAQRRRQRAYSLMLLPALLLLIGIMIPFAQGVWTSLTDKKTYIANPSFVGLANYADLLMDPRFLSSLGRTLLYVASILAVQLPLATFVAVLLARSSIGSYLGRRVLVLPLLVPPIVAGLMWKTMMQPSSGVLNHLLGLIGLGPLPWLTDTGTALWSVVLIDTWAFLPFSALILLAGLQSLPPEIEEASRVDGAGAWKAFKYVSLPWLAPYLVLVAIFRVADSLKQFDLIWPVTRGGPLDSTRLLHVMGYEEAFRFSSPASAMAIIFILWLLVYGISFLLLKLWRRTINAVG